MTLHGKGIDGEVSPNGGVVAMGKDDSGNAQALKVNADGELVMASSAGAGTEYDEGETDVSFTGPVVLAEGPSNTAKPLQLDANDHLQVDIGADSVGLATSAKQDTGNTLLGTIDADTGGIATSTASIDTKTPALGQALADASVPVVLPAAQVSTLTPQTDALTDTQLRATPVPVSATDLDIRDLTNADVVTAELSATDNAVLDDIAAKLGTIDADTGNLPTIETNTDFGTVTGGGTETGALRVTIANNSTGVVSVDDNGGSLTVDAPVGTPVFVRLSDGSSAISTLPVSLASVPSHQVTNAGTFAVQVDGNALTALQLIDDTIFADDAAFTIGTSKVSMAGATVDEASTDSADEGDAVALRATANRQLIVTQRPNANGEGLDPFRSLDIDETEEDVKTSAGKLYGYYFFNAASSPRWLKFYNATAANVTVGSTTPLLTLGLPAGGAGHIEFSNGIPFSTAISVACTTGIADADTGAPSANDVSINVFYK